MKIVFILFFLSVNIYAYDLFEIGKTEFINLKQYISSDYNDSELGTINSRKEILSKALQDDSKVINSLFSIPDYFKSSTMFWLKVYTVYDTSQVIFHDKDNFDIVYKELDFSKIWNSNLSVFIKSNLQSHSVVENTKLIKNQLREILNESDLEKVKSFPISQTLVNAGFIFESNYKKRSNQLKGLINNIRAQTGQRNKQRAGIQNYIPYNQFFKSSFTLFELPQELTGIPFLESSFANSAHSKVGALGIWQIMPYLAKKLMPQTKEIDYRSNQFISTIAALHLLRQNYKILKRWDLAVTAYNSGTKHLINAHRKLKIPLNSLSLDTVFERYQNSHLGFASKNFYSEFLALIRVLTFRKQIFSLDNDDTETNVDFYMTKCNFKLNDYVERKYIEPKMNMHLESNKITYKMGTIIVSSKPLPEKYFLKVENNWIVKSLPIDWKKKYFKRYNCSTR